MDENIGPDAVVSGVGATYYLPPLGNHRTQHLGRRPSVARLREVDPDFVVTSSIFGQTLFPERSEGAEFFAGLQQGGIGYELVFRHRGEPLFDFLRLEHVSTNFDKINPEIRIFRRTRARETGRDARDHQR